MKETWEKGGLPIEMDETQSTDYGVGQMGGGGTYFGLGVIPECADL